MPRPLKHHEQKLLKHSNLYDWETDRNDEAVMGKYGIRKRSQLTQYRKTARKIRELTVNLAELPPSDEVRMATTNRLALLLYELGLNMNPKATLNELKEFEASALMKRRLPVVLKEIKMAPNIESATNFVEHGHVRVGPTVVKEINYHLKKGQEDFVTWTDGSTMQKKVQRFRDEQDDFIGK
ncbi:U3_small nucleolar ribonucleoprotein IMP3 [Hexamita inflata]|uniref:U3 small nucleolar ribonucleoprotein IMP3 n=1 Tax=Hexamita inflata TaxID=28002 RepID=A0AA86TUX8_9EUKA|nr:U3 small nucleolar ribonucleoprotein IMP3 [Hexamita inflata]CAI9929606.1 U3 small nucleolar ribonucleoprotein IMP3 [Hexamita inflata]CAI9942702.1 U3 small nucleolar ribonucleoprotein IMP3 [Hexamita inflata]